MYTLSMIHNVAGKFYHFCCARKIEELLKCYDDVCLVIERRGYPYKNRRVTFSIRNYMDIDFQKNEKMYLHVLGENMYQEEQVAYEICEIICELSSKKLRL